MNELQGALKQMEAALTDSDIYTEGNKDKLKKLLAEQASAKQALEETEMAWLSQQEALDTMIAEQEAML